MALFENPNYDFIKWRWHAIALSVLVILAGLGLTIARGGLPLGIDFSGGTIVVVKFEQSVSEEQVRDAVAGLPGEKVVQTYGSAADREILVRLPQTGREEGFNLEQGARQVVEAIAKANIGKFEVMSTEVVGPVIGADLQRRGIWATFASILGITAYIAFRFRPSFAAGAIVATLHDIFVTVAFLSFFGYELSLNVVAALLAITGYSVNDTIVVFDRVRENFGKMRRDSLEKVVNTSVNQTLGRTVITAGTTFLSVLALYLFGGRGARGLRLHDARRHRQRHLLDRVHRGRHRHPRERSKGQGHGRARGVGLGIRAEEDRGEEQGRRRPLIRCARRSRAGPARRAVCACLARVAHRSRRPRACWDAAGHAAPWSGFAAASSPGSSCRCRSPSASPPSSGYSGRWTDGSAPCSRGGLVTTFPASVC